MLNIPISKGKNLQLLILIITISLLHYSTINGLFQRWIKWDQALSHALPTLAITGYFLWQMKFVSGNRDKKWIQCVLYIALLCSSLTWASFQINSIEILSALAVFSTLLIYIACCYSLTTSIKLLPLLGLLTFTLPLLSQLNDLLISISSVITGKLVATSNITALIEGNSISIPGGKIIIADGCSGLRYLTISILLGYIICLLNKSSWKQIIYIMLTSVFIGLLANWLRIFILVLVGYNTNMQSSLMQDHETFGWVLFSLIVGPALYLAPVNKNSERPTPLPNPNLIIPSIIVFIGPLLLFFADHQAPKANPLKIENIFTTNTKQLPSAFFSAINKRIHGNHEAAFIEINNTKVYVGLVTSTPDSREKLVPYISTLFNKDTWREIDSLKQTQNNFHYIILKKFDSEQKRVLAYSFQVGSDTTKKYHTAKLLQLKAKLLNEQYFGLITLESECESDCKQEAQSISELATHWNNTLK